MLVILTTEVILVERNRDSCHKCYACHACYRGYFTHYQKETGAKVTIVTLVTLVTLATDVTPLARVMMLKKHHILLCQTSRSAHSLSYV